MHGRAGMWCHSGSRPPNGRWSCRSAFARRPSIHAPNSFYNRAMGLLDWLKPAAPLDHATQALVNRAVDTVEPLLKARRAGHKLAPPVRHAFDYCERLAQAIPGPIPITRSAFASEPLVHALFGSADDIGKMLARSQCVRTTWQYRRPRRRPVLRAARHAPSRKGRLRRRPDRGGHAHRRAATGPLLHRPHAGRTQPRSRRPPTGGWPKPCSTACSRASSPTSTKCARKGRTSATSRRWRPRSCPRRARAPSRTRAGWPNCRNGCARTSMPCSRRGLIETLAAYLAAPEASLRLDPVQLGRQPLRHHRRTRTRTRACRHAALRRADHARPAALGGDDGAQSTARKRAPRSSASKSAAATS